MRRKRVPPIAWLLSGGTAVAMLVLVVRALALHGQSVFFNEGDAYLFRATARDLFGQGHAFVAVGRASEIPYRYGRIGLPFLAWLLALGRSGWVASSLIAWPARRVPIAGLAAAYAVLAACLGPNALKYAAETMRVLALPQVVALLCIVFAVTGPHDNEIYALSAPNGDL